MLLKECGFRPVYHNVCVFELNDKLRDLIKACPDASKSSHAVCYGYIDSENGLMLEVLCGGKKAPKYFYFKDIYEGERISIPATELEDVEFSYFEKLEPRFRKQLSPRIETLEKYNAPEDLEKTRSEELMFLDEFRDLQHPDVVRVVFVKNGFQNEDVRVRLTGIGDHCLVGTVQTEPKQNFGVKIGDTISFYTRHDENDRVELFVDFNDDEPRRLTKEDLENGSLLKLCIVELMNEEPNQEHFGILLKVLHSCSVLVPCEIELSTDVLPILDKLKKEGKSVESLEGEEADKFRAGMIYHPHILENNGDGYIPAFTDEEEMGDQFESATFIRIPFLRVIEMAKGLADELKGIVINAFTDDFIVKNELFDPIILASSLIDDEITEEHDEGIQYFSNFEDLKLSMIVDRMAAFNYALYQNKIKPIRGIRILNDTGDPLTGLSLRISSDFEFFNKYETSLPDIPSGKPISLPDPHLVIFGKVLAEMSGAENALITIELCKDGEVLCGARGHLLVLAYDQWMKGVGYRYLLPAFVIPNHPIISLLMHDAAEILGKWGKSTSLDAYQTNNPNRVRELAAAAYAAIQKKNIIYAVPPVSYFEVDGQQIRTPETIMEQRLGTCMDMTLLYAALLEAMGLHPLLVLKQGHIFAGVWLKERSEDEIKSSNTIIDTVEPLTMRIDNGSDELTFVECTAMCSDKKNINYEEAEYIAKQRNLDPATFEMAIDVYLSRLHGIYPIPPRMKENGSYQIEVSDKSDDEITEAPTDLGLSISDIGTVEVKHRKITSKRELWESKLLDLSTHNMLLNLPVKTAIQPIMSSHIDELEDALSDGHEFNLLPAAEWITSLCYTKTGEDGTESEPKQWLQEAINERGIYEMTSWPKSADFDFNEKFRQEYHNHRLYTYCTPKQLERELTAIYRASRASQQENGVSSLFLAVGLLRWFEEPESKKPCYAPLILIPIEIVRKSANQGYALHAREDEPHFNTTLLEMLKQNYNLVLNGLDPLPVDDHGINIKKIFAIVRNSIFSVKGWDVVETCVIGNFSFAQFAMWNDIHTSGEMLEKSDVIRSLIKGHVDWNVTTSDDLDEEQTYLPITVDATQLKAIKMAAHGTTFVLHGPPGTGKSQTITGMIANLMAQGKKVLFVAEKMAALSVVQKRLASLGIGDFCLELHSNKANKKQVLVQLEKALEIKHPSKKTEYEEYLKRTQKSRNKLDGYANHLHKVYENGYSLRELIDLYETVIDSEDYVPFNKYEAGKLTREQIKLHSSLISQLIAAGTAVGRIAEHPLTGVGLSSYSAEVRSTLRKSLAAYSSSLEEVTILSSKIALALGIEAPKNKDEINDLQDLIGLYNENRKTEAEYLSLMNVDSSTAYAYFDQKDAVDTEEQDLLKVWKAEFLTMNMADILSKHESAGKRFFGKNNAMSVITAEVQSFANAAITYEQIPDMLQMVMKHQSNIEELHKAHSKLPVVIRGLVDHFGSREAYCSAETSAAACKAQVANFPGGLDAILSLASKSETNSLFAEYKDKVSAMISAEDHLNALLERKACENSDHWFESEKKFCCYLIDNASELKNWGLYNQVRQECVKVGLLPVIEAYENGFNSGLLEKAYQKGLYYALINYIISTDDILSSFSGVTFNESIQQFKRLDDQMLKLTKQEIYYLLATKVPTSWDSPEIGTELNLLRKAIGSNARGMSIRTLFERIPHVLQALCPCMLMSPNSVAQYLAQDNNLFDVVIFDEASQLPTCKAVGALSRAKNAVIVGDPKQMPPTSFFAGSGPEVEDLALADLDSILDDALALGIPSQHLQWHYRSTHESLIAFSNHQFYDNQMYTFPSANDRERHVTAIHVDGLYRNNTNIQEAEAVVQEIIRRFLDPELKQQSIGVVTFNVKQQSLIEDLLAKQYQINPDLDIWANGGDDPLFVKNLENVQGDERDVILFSVGYGREEKKARPSMNFGPINKPGGGKRLNVAFSRARVTMMIFVSLYSSEMSVPETSPEGLVAFRDFLKYAEGQDIRTDASTENADKLARAGILQSICKAIANHGYQCENMVGHSDFHIDIAVVDPYVPTMYMMGILLDGEGYKQTKNTRDREIAQIGVLKHLGWSIQRVWTMDWWDNREKVINILLEKLDELKEASKKRIEERKALEEAKKAEEAARLAEAERLKAELEAQAAEVIAEEDEAGNSIDDEKTVSIPVETTSESAVSDEKSEEQAEPVNVETPVTEVMTDPDPVTQQEDDPIVVLIQKVTAAKGKVVDKREKGGALWIVGGKNLDSIMKEFKALGINFIFKVGGGKATGGKDGWWAKTDIVLPDPSKITSPNVKPATQNDTKPTEVCENIGTSSVITSDETDSKANQDVLSETMTVPVQKSEQKKHQVIAEYVEATLPVSLMTQIEYADAKNANVISKRILAVLSVEAPILKDSLFRKVWASFGIQKSTAAIEVTEKILKSLKIKNTKQKGIIFCWNPEQDPKTYDGIRVTNERSGDEICQQEIKNAVCYVLQKNGNLSKDELIKEVSLVFGYKRLGKNLEAAIAAGVQYAKTSGVIISVGSGCFSIKPDNQTEGVQLILDTDLAESEDKTPSKANAIPENVSFDIQDNENVLYCEGSTYKAAGIKHGRSFVVLKGSRISNTTTPTCPASALSFRTKYADVIGDDFVLTSDITFASPSGAACFVAGGSRNGYTEWHLEDGTLLKDVH